MCHVILALPVVSLPVLWLWPLSTAVPVYAVILIVSLGVYVYGLRAMRRPVENGIEKLLRSTGKVIEVAPRSLRIRVHSEDWNAESSSGLRVGDTVRVVGIDGLVLRVEGLTPKVTERLSQD